jgi:hypothetical protein
MMPLEIAEQVCAEGRMVLFTSGKYSGEKPRFLGRALKPFSMRAVKRRFHELRGDHLPNWEVFITWMVREGYVEPVEHVEIHMDSHWGERDLVEMLPIQSQADIIDMAVGKACPNCASHHVVPVTRDGHVQPRLRHCADCGFEFDIPES